MNKSRRDFIKIAVVAAAAGLLNSVPSASAQENADAGSTANDAAGDVLSGATAADFKQYVGAEFMFLTGAGATAAVLSEVSETIVKSKRPRRLPPGRRAAQNFVLSFRTAAGEFPQATYRLWHRAFGEFDLFLVPGGSGADDSTVLHAVINRR